MKTVDALTLRQSLGKVLRELEKDGGPILVQRRGKPAGVLIGLKDWKERFADREADEKRRQIVERIRQMHFKLPQGQNSTDLLRAMREGRER